MICPRFAALDEFYLLRKYDTGSMGNKHISYRQNIGIHDFFIIVGYCGIEEIFKAAYLLL
jgi:hypothetical protein